MKMRKWQVECIAKAMTKFASDQSHFLCLATPGAGKTLMAAELARQLLKRGMIDLVICFSPSTIVADDFRVELENQTQCRMDGRLASKGCSLTYQSMLNLSDSFWSLFRNQKVLVIFDEIHHCAGHTLENSNVWGHKIIRHIQGRATFTLALTGTPWRSDKVPIALARYSVQGRIQRDYQYGLSQAIEDKVCRRPRIIAVDNDQITITGKQVERFRSFRELLESSRCNYQQLLENDNLILYLLRKSSEKLGAIRRLHPGAGGLIIAASVEHAHKIQSLLYAHLRETAMVATYMEEDPQSIINAFRSGTQKWIISVGMISEGTNIPRLRVCCHLTRVKTELHFRQVLGRILRASSDDQEESYLLMPAEPSLVEYAYRISEDVPDVEAVKIEWMADAKDTDPAMASTSRENINIPDDPVRITLDEPPLSTLQQNQSTETYCVPSSLLAEAYDATLNVFGRFRQEVLQLPL